MPVQPSLVIKIEEYLTDPNGEWYIYYPYSGSICFNIKKCLQKLGFEGMVLNQKFDKELKKNILKFQIDQKHTNQDGVFGPLTRRLLATQMAIKFGSKSLDDLIYLKKTRLSTVFLSYARKDNKIINKLDQWLQDNGVEVIRDNRDFRPGKQIKELIEESIINVDKVLIVYSENSRSRDWTTFERNIAYEIEKDKESPFIIYIQLDNTPLPKFDVNTQSASNLRCCMIS